MRLSAARGQLSIELQRPVPIGPVLVEAMEVSLPGLKFPIDLSGGVTRFRNRRGVLERLRIRAPFVRLLRHIEPGVRNALGPGRCELVVMPGAHGLVLGIHHGRAALAFDLVFAPDDDRLRFVVVDARGAGLGAHAHGAALRAVAGIVASSGSCAGSVLGLDRGIRELVRELTIDAGARAPETRGLHFGEWTETDDGVEIEARRDAEAVALPPRAIRGLEAARWSETADDALARGDLDAARSELLSALERAPRHPALLLRLAEIDLVAGHRPESALSMLIEGMAAVDAGPVGARLLAATGDLEGATAAMRRAAEREVFGRLASLLFLEAAEYTERYRDRAVLLDEAVARAPGLAEARWDRAGARLAAGDVQAAVTDFDHLEAATHGSAARFEVCERAGRMLLDARAPSDAARMYQRALRYLPGSAEASAGLARSFLEVGDGPRAVTLLTRAVALTGKTGPSPGLALELAEGLADITQDFSAAIAHARSVPFGVTETPRARTLEGRWLAVLGDLVGASVAYARARESMEVLPKAAPIPAEWSLEAARFEAEVRGDWRAAQRHLATALVRHPNDPGVRMMFRKAGLALGGAAEEITPDRGREGRGVEPSPPPPQEREPQAAPRAPASAEAGLGIGEELHGSGEVDEGRIARLSEMVQGDPTNREAVRELCSLLSRARRMLDLFALVSARLEETSSPEDRGWLLSYRAQALHSLIDAARAAGREEEAALYDEALGMEPTPG